MRSLLAVTAALLCACASASSAIAPATPRQTTAPSSATPELDHAQTTQLARGLGAGATYADLVRAARVLLRAQASDSSAECLLRRDASGYVLAADLLPALDPLPDTAVELDPALQRESGLLGVLTAYGPMGSAQPTLGLASFTTFAPAMARDAPIALLLTNEGVYVRRSDVPATADDGPLPATAAVARALSTGEPAHAVLFVAAEASVSLDELAALLALLPQQQTVAFAVPLPRGTKLPVRPVPASAHACPAGLPAPAPGSPEGDLDAKAIVAELGPLRSAAEACLVHARGPASAGGRLVLALRIAADGHTQQACLMEDAIGDAPLAGCVIDAANALRFPAPSPKGFVDVHLPLALAPEGPRLQRALCE